MADTLPKEIMKVIAALGGAGFEAYLVGGCVRDLIMGNAPTDWDVTTNARPDDIQRLFPDSVYDNEFGTVRVITRSDDPTLKTIEITPFRKEAKYSDKRHPDSVSFADRLEDDLARRDFTVNAMALKIPISNDQFPKKFQIPNSKFQILDLFNGQQDIEKKIIRAVGDPNERFGEDALRMMRAVRFAVQLGFVIEDATARAIHEHAGLLRFIAKERIRDEYIKIIMSNHSAEGIELLRRLGLLALFLPELEEGWEVGQNKHHIYTVWEHNLRALAHATEEQWPLVVRIGALFHDIAKPRCKVGDGPDSTFYNHEVVGAKMSFQVLSRLRFSADETKKIAKLVRYHLFYYNVDEVRESAVRRLIRRVGPQDMEDLIRVRICDRIGSGVPKAEPYKLRHFRFLVEKLQRDPISVRMLTINGDDIKRITGLPQSPIIGSYLFMLLDDVLDDPAKNTPEYLERRVKELADLSEEELAALAKQAKEKALGLEEEEVTQIKKKHWVK
jgi:poly(A) polymerase/tRNA nucleotidyltransferase (CCA-adding enzyme)